MFRTLLALLLISAPALAGDKPAAHGAAEKKVWRIDSLIATEKAGVITVQAKGAVQTGGWKNARLKLVKSDGHGAMFEFVAAAPPASMTVIDAVVPVTATAQLRGRIASVKAAAEANEMTSQVLR
jgi:hypothetical protein